MPNIQTNIQWEVTDTFNGEANYSWVRRGKIETHNEDFSDLAAVRRVKKAIEWSGVRCRVERYNETIALFPYGSCTVCFITFHSFGVAS